MVQEKTFKKTRGTGKDKKRQEMTSKRQEKI